MIKWVLKLIYNVLKMLFWISTAVVILIIGFLEAPPLLDKMSLVREAWVPAYGFLKPIENWVTWNAIQFTPLVYLLTIMAWPFVIMFTKIKPPRPPPPPPPDDQRSDIEVTRR